MRDPFFFGYGSLVNRTTHDYRDAHRAGAVGWRRVWRHTDLRDVAFLTVAPDPDCEIEGLIAAVPGGDWLALDDREHAYDRVPVTQAVRHALPHALDVALYAIPEGRHGRPDRAHPILQSYIDVVLQGYLREFGPEGAARFIATTDGWDAPLLDDRMRPIYPRARTLAPAERDRIDELLADLPLRRVAAE